VKIESHTYTSRLEIYLNALNLCDILFPKINDVGYFNALSSLAGRLLPEREIFSIIALVTHSQISSIVMVYRAREWMVRWVEDSLFFLERFARSKHSHNISRRTGVLTDIRSSTHRSLIALRSGAIDRIPSNRTINHGTRPRLKKWVGVLSHD
jgi:hypothetical protein